MSAAAELGLLVDDPRRLVFVREGVGPSIVDGWAVDQTSIAARVAASNELVLLDPLGFPYEALGPTGSWPVITLVLPSDVPVHDLAIALEEVLLRHLTPFDRIVGGEQGLTALRESKTVPSIVPEVVVSDGDRLAGLHRAWRDERVESHRATFGSFVGFRDDLVSRHVGEYGAHQRSDLALLLSIVRPGDVVLDVGAHVGSFAVPLAQAAGADGRLVAFESNPAALELLLENLRANDVMHAEVVHAAVGARSGEPVAVVVEDASNSGGAATRSVGAHDAVAATSTITLDEWWHSCDEEPRVDVMKLDVEGNEAQVLAGSPELLAATLPVLYVEVSAELLARRGDDVDDVLGPLEHMGYTCFINALDRNRPDDRFELAELSAEAARSARVADVLCVHRDRFDRLPGD